MLYLGGHNLKIVLGLRNLVWTPKSPKILGFHQEHLFRKKCNLKVCREGGSLHTFKLHFYHMYCDVNEIKPNQNNIVIQWGKQCFNFWEHNIFSTAKAWKRQIVKQQTADN